MQLLPSPKWKLVVDIGEDDPLVAADSPVAQSVNTNAVHSTLDLSDSGSVGEKITAGSVGKDHRIDEIVSLLGELMPSDPSSALAPYLSGFMSLRLLLLRTSRTPEEEDHARTMLDSYSSYSQGGRPRADIGVMLARDYMFLCQQKTAQPASFFSVGQGLVNSTQNQALSGYSVFDVQNSPTLGPIPLADALSIVSN